MKNIDAVKKAIKGNEEAFEMLIKNESEKLYRTAFLYVQNKEDALDVVQETVYKAFVSIRQVKNPEFFYTWLTRILIHTAYALLTKRKSMVQEDISSELPDMRPADIEGKLDVMEALSLLNENYQTAIILFYYQDLTINSIAKTMGKPENTIKTYLRRAKAELKEIIEGGKSDEQRAH
ncbi:sigma-70 family RNA polymerase sigma factor [Planococcus sp. N028]|uniref:Sigma-70 family RNA polymerase sigma factor n=1 Tax=Planococcus shixiaomingii TaxID=3058393 RepID=A0ABT8N5N6_9BACL|nr:MULTISPECIES: sigma-70 family RNA polymerase sigma factor [unclassified Planococcus (in: firmicutes)]MDN7243209.1 sigma-70 family RNA polymerase sigma factor [Planococcus sp. N028]WKA55152.1 sigma-70 family RNA polymerase sigma factor [Planococcus sp. N022]